MACGTPVIAFNIGGIPDIVDNYINGILVEPYEFDLMANEIAKILEGDKLNSMSINAKKKLKLL